MVDFLIIVWNRMFGDFNVDRYSVAFLLKCIKGRVVSIAESSPRMLMSRVCLIISLQSFHFNRHWLKLDMMTVLHRNYRDLVRESSFVLYKDRFSPQSLPTSSLS